jgi:hypothetical protein
MTEHTIRAIFDDKTIRVYQAYRPEIAEPALAAGRFVPPFKVSRMTWIKPSFCWMMYRSGYASKPGQERVLGIDIDREGFEWALDHAVLSTYHEPTHGDHDLWKKSVADAPVRIQWDPERDPMLEKIEGVRSIQIGLTGEAVERYVNSWIVAISDLTPLVHEMNAHPRGRLLYNHNPSLLEKTYPVHNATVLKRLRMETQYQTKSS